jgi:iron complex outermembrane recepter protein
MLALSRGVDMRRTFALLVTTAAWIAAPAFAQEASNMDGAGSADDIVVTAQRREERLQDVPIAVTAFSAANLEARQIRNVVDIMSTVPNLHASNNIGQGSATTVFIRGVGETESIATIDSPVGFYIDDVFIGRQGVNNLALFDIDRVEVLRGPQGTLYGRNTSAGAIKIVTKKPVFENNVAGEASYGRFDTWTVKGSANLALSDSLALRGNVLFGDGDGDTFNRVLNRRVNGTQTTGIRLAARALASETVEINLAGDWGRSNQNGRYGVDVAGILRPPAPSLYISTTGTVMRNIGKSWGLHGTIDWEASDAFAIKSITAYRATDQRYNLELTDQPVSLFTVYTDTSAKQFSQELQASGTAVDDRLNYVAGLYYFNERNASVIADYVFSSFFFRRDLRVKNDAYAVFAQLDYDLSDQFSVILGGRYTIDKKAIDISVIGDFTGTDYQFSPFTGIPLFSTPGVCGGVIPARPSRPVKCQIKTSKFTPKLGLEFKPNENFLLYATYTNGFKSGGWSARVTDPNEFFDFDPEEIDSYELGIKSTIANGAGTVNLTGFYYDYQNLFNTGTTTTGFGIATSNAKIWGLELETNWRVATGVRLFANAAWQDNKRKSITASTVVLGDRLQRTPKWQTSIGFNIDRQITDRISIIANADYAHSSKHFVSPQNFPETLTGPIDEVNASVGLGFDDKRYQLILSCKNCFGETYFNQALPFAFLGFTTLYPSPRSSWAITGKMAF